MIFFVIFLLKILLLVLNKICDRNFNFKQRILKKLQIILSLELLFCYLLFLIELCLFRLFVKVLLIFYENLVKFKNKFDLFLC